MKAWLKGGLIGGGISMIYHVLFIAMDYLTFERFPVLNSFNKQINQYVISLIVNLNIPFHIQSLFEYGRIYSMLYQILIIGLTYFVVGAIIGFILNLIKNNLFVKRLDKNKQGKEK